MRIPQWLISLSIFINHLTGGPIGYSLCARFWEGKLKGSYFHTGMVSVSNTLFFWDKDHCRKAYTLRTK